MRLSCVFALGLAVFGLGAAVEGAAALDVQHNVHRPTTSSKHLTTVKRTTSHSTKSSVHRVHTTSSSAKLHSAVVTHSRRHRYYERFTASSFAKGDIFEGDVTAGEDPVVRQAAIDALGDMNGTVVAIEPTSGRILATVNQKLALSSG